MKENYYLKKSTKDFILKFKTHCRYCGSIETELNIDHIIPKSKGGNHILSNLTIACKSCNSSKGVFSIDEWEISCNKNKNIHLEKFEYYNNLLNNPLRNKNHLKQNDNYLFKKISFHKYNYEKYVKRLNSINNKIYLIIHN
jgi:hypothetical protein